MECRDVQERLGAWREGELSPAEGDAVAAHLGECPSCKDFLARLDALDGLWAGTAEPVLSESARQRILAAIHRGVAGEDEPAGEVWTVEDVALYLKVPAEAVYEMVDDLPFFSFGRHVRIRKERLLAWIDEQERIAHTRTLLRAGRRH